MGGNTEEGWDQGKRDIPRFEKDGTEPVAGKNE
jgi:hypothetical protein